jgi:hypothetical protein
MQDGVACRTSTAREYLRIKANVPRGAKAACHRNQAAPSQEFGSRFAEAGMFHVEQRRFRRILLTTLVHEAVSPTKTSINAPSAAVERDSEAPNKHAAPLIPIVVLPGMIRPADVLNSRTPLAPLRPQKEGDQPGVAAEAWALGPLFTFWVLAHWDTCRQAEHVLGTVALGREPSRRNQKLTATPAPLDPGR